MRVIIDGYNLAHASTWLGLKARVAEPVRMRHMMVALLARYAERTDDRMTVVFDGLPADRQAVIDLGARAGIEVLFSGADVDADTQIERMLEVSTGARDTLVVSSDRRVRAAASRRRARSCPAGEFFSRIRRALAESTAAPRREPREKFVGPDESEINAWMRLFGFDAEEKKE